MSLPTQEIPLLRNFSPPKDFLPCGLLFRPVQRPLPPGALTAGTDCFSKAGLPCPENSAVLLRLPTHHHALRAPRPGLRPEQALWPMDQGKGWVGEEGTEHLSITSVALDHVDLEAGLSNMT